MIYAKAHWRRMVYGFVFLFGLVGSSTATAEALSLSALDSFIQYRVCANGCASDNTTCLDACATPDATWDKNKDTNFTNLDLELSVLEYWDEGAQTYICYENEAVVPIAACNADSCLSNYSETECADDDGDGIPQWLEEQLGSSDSTPNEACNNNSTCGFVSQCQFVTELNAQYCVPRDCGEGACTAFHLETVSNDNQELIVHLHYDYSPIPATVLDLKIEYNPTALTLLDARPLPVLQSQNKEIVVSQITDSKLRLVVYDTLSTTPIPTGAIVEMIFKKESSQQTTVEFSDSNFDQRYAMAPIQEEGESDTTHNQSLTDDDLWGDAVYVPASTPQGQRLVLSYDFANPNSPNNYKDVPSAGALCAAFNDCNNAENDDQNRLLAMLNALQAGHISFSEQIVGVVGEGAYFDGAFDHLQLPLTLNANELGGYSAADQSFTVSMWFYAEGEEQQDISTNPQILFANHASNEESRMGLMLVPNAGGIGTNLVFFDGAHQSTESLALIESGIALRTWHHLAMTFDATASELAFYVDGSPRSSLALNDPANAISCPQFDEGSGTLTLPIEGDFLGGKSPDYLYFAFAQNNLFGIERMDLNGLTTQEIIRDGNASFRDPDYHPLLDKLVYASSASGNYEIWMSDGDGNEDSRQQITMGFGDTFRGVFAQRPRWAPDGTGIVFESNVFSMTKNHNAFSRGYHLYYIPYDPAADNGVGAVAVPTYVGSSETTVTLEYSMQVENVTGGVMLGSQITSSPGHQFNPVWLRGSEGSDHGRLLFSSKNQYHKNKKIFDLTIPGTPNLQGTPGEMDNLGGEESDGEILVTAMRNVEVTGEAGGNETALMLYKRERVVYEESSQVNFTLDINSDNVELTFYHAPTGYAENCWDTNFNAIEDSAEDVNQDGSFTKEDCYPHELRGLNIAFDSLRVTFLPSGTVPGELLLDSQTGDLLKVAAAEEISTSDGNYVRFEVKSPYNNLPIPAGTLATLVFPLKPDQTANVNDFALTERKAEYTAWVKDITEGGAASEQLALSGQVAQLEDAVFSPDGNHLVLAGISNARPVIIKTEDFSEYGYTVAGAQKLSMMPMKVQGLSWSKQERYFACNWAGNHRDRFSRFMTNGFRGGIDELKMYSYVRNEAALRSEAQRGHERLIIEGRDDAVASLMPKCPGGTDAECPSYHLCEDYQCELVACDPNDAYSCDRGLCTLRPNGVHAESDGFDFVCTSECNVDQQCFTEECLNGPCRFCATASNSCLECRPRTDDYGSFAISYVEGCPDRNSFMCDQGSCMSECYNFDNGQSEYLCDNATEYCYQGRCVLREWEWTDFAPATFNGLGEVRYNYDYAGLGFDKPYTEALSQTYGITIKAYGVEDYGHSPELLVEGKVNGQTMYGGDWFKIGTLLIFNRTAVQAENNTYHLTTTYPITDLRITLVTAEYQDMNTASGRKPAGSRYNLGYRINIPKYEAYHASAAHGRSIANPTGSEAAGADAYRGFLWGGQPAVVITGIAGTNNLNLQWTNITDNKICSYEGTALPIDNGRAKKVFYGDIALEESYQKDYYCAHNACPTSELISYPAADEGVAILNCDFKSPDNAAQAARLQFSGLNVTPVYVQPPITETANACTVEVDQNRSEICYEWAGGRVSMDILDSDVQPFRTLDFSFFKNAGFHESDAAYTEGTFYQGPYIDQVEDPDSTHYFTEVNNASEGGDNGS